MVMAKIDIKKAQTIAKKKGLNPSKVKDRKAIQFTKGGNDRLQVITWEEFEAIMNEKGLAIYEDAGFMRLMKA